MSNNTDTRERINKMAGRKHELTRQILGIDWFDLNSQARRAIEYIADQEENLQTALSAVTAERDRLRACLADVRYRVEQGRVWNGMGWTLTGLSPNGQQKVLDAVAGAQAEQSVSAMSAGEDR